jgi:hypothetical protein
LASDVRQETSGTRCFEAVGRARRHRLRASLAGGLFFAVIGGAVAAAELPAAICAVGQAIGCEPCAPCERNLPAAINLPTLMRIDPVRRVVISRSQTGGERRSDIGSITTLETTAILQGVDGGNAWSMHVDLQNGRFSLTSAGNDEAFIAFGSCSARILE